MANQISMTRMQPDFQDIDMSDLTAREEQHIYDRQILRQESLAEDETQQRHFSHDFHPDDDVIACDWCGCRSYNREATRPCEGANR